MGFLEKVITILMLPIGVLSILEITGIFSLSLPVDKLFVGAIAMILLQIINLIMLKSSNGQVGIMTFVIALIFIIPAVVYLLSGVFGSVLGEQLPLVLSIMMIVESLYALH